MFCSTTCLEVAFERFHRFECPVMDQLLASGSVHIGVRMLFIALSTFDDSIEKLENFMKENENESLTIFDVSEHATASEKKKSRLLAFLSLARSSKSYSLAQHEEILKKHSLLAEIWETHQEFIKNFIERVIQISDFGFHGLFSGSTKQDDVSDTKKDCSNLQQPIGNGSMLFCSLINHSCSSNVFRVYFDGKIAVVVCRPIQKGSQLFDCYK